jgi:mRNA interferase MazF
VVQANEFNENGLTILVCPLTTEVIENLPLRPVVSAGLENGLWERSQIMTDKMLALHRGRIRSVLGSVDPNTREQLDQALLIILGLGR